MIRKAFVMKIHPDSYNEYQKRHNPIWDALKQTLKDHGAHHYSIFLDKKQNLLFGYVEIESEEKWAKVATTEICQKWWRFMSDIMPTNPDYSPQSEDLLPVFYLD